MTYFIFQNISYILWLVRPTNRSFQNIKRRIIYFLKLPVALGLRVAPRHAGAASGRDAARRGEDEEAAQGEEPGVHQHCL